ncbi:MAG: hypothetical protein ACRDFB_10025 [Rhabdochlamydiaceae bacterium]
MILASCGYKTISSEDRPTLSIPYVRGDEEGFLTNAVISEMSRTGLYDYVSSGGELELKIAVVGNHEEVIGYRYDRSEKKGNLQQNLLATENRRHAAAEVTLYRASEDQPIIGPIVVTATAEFDYIDVSTIHELAFITPSGKRAKVIDFSEGQLDSVEGAQDNVVSPLYANLAKKIAAVVQQYFLKSSDD